MENEIKNRVTFENRIGSIRLAVWKNQAEGRKAWYSVSIVRRYKDKENDEFKDAHTFNGVADLLAVGELVSQGMAFLRAQENASTAEAA